MRTKTTVELKTAAIPSQEADEALAMRQVFATGGLTRRGGSSHRELSNNGSARAGNSTGPTVVVALVDRT